MYFTIVIDLFSSEQQIQFFNIYNHPLFNNSNVNYTICCTYGVLSCLYIHQERLSGMFLSFISCFDLGMSYIQATLINNCNRIDHIMSWQGGMTLMVDKIKTKTTFIPTLIEHKIKRKKEPKQKKTQKRCCLRQYIFGRTVFDSHI